MLVPWKKSYNKPRQCIKKQIHHFADEVHIVKAMVFPVVMYGCESWTIKSESWTIKSWTIKSAEELMFSNGGAGEDS